MYTHDTEDYYHWDNKDNDLYKHDKKAHSYCQRTSYHAKSAKEWVTMTKCFMQMRDKNLTNIFQRHALINQASSHAQTAIYDNRAAL